MLGLLPWGIFSGAVMFAEKGDPWVVLTYAMILFFVVCFSYYRIKVSKAKVWRVVLEAVGLLMVEYLFMILAGLALVYYDLVIARQTKIDRCAVDGIQRIFELEFMFWSVCHNAIKEFFKQCFEYFRITAVHRF